MVVLLIGGSCVLIDAMIDKLNKNGHRVYLLTGNRDKRQPYRRVFERYDLPYESSSVKDVMESVRPDAVVFLGAYDTNYGWDDAREESVRFTAGLANILSAYSIVKGGCFLYLSSQEVYGEPHINDITEDEPVSPKGFRAMAVAQGEEICATYRKTQGMGTVVLRFDGLYWVPRKGEAQGGPCFRLCLEALKTGKVPYNSRRTYSMIHLNDAVELTYNIMHMLPVLPDHGTYHISSGEPVPEEKLAAAIKDEMGDGITVVDSTVGMGNRLVLGGRRYKKEYTHEIFVPYEKGARQVASFMKHNSVSFLTEDDRGGGLGTRLWNKARKAAKALFPFLENVICFIPFFLLYNGAPESRFFARLDFYLLYVLLFALVYGQKQAAFSGFLAVAGYIYSQAEGRSGFDVLSDYNTYVWIAQLFIVGLSVGYLKDQLHFIKTEDQGRMDYLHGQLKDIEDINDSNVRIKHNFESQVVNHKDSLGKIYEISSTLEQRGPEEVLFYAAEVLGKLMDCSDVAVYTVANGDYARLFSSTSQDARKLGNSIKYTDMASMHEALAARRVYINQRMEDRMPMMASAVYSEDRMQLILMLWGIPWERMTLGEANRLTIIGSLIQNAVVRANRYLEALHNRRYVEGTNVLDEEAFTQLAKAFSDAKEKGLAEYVLLEVLSEGQDHEAVAEVLGPAIRQTDYLGVMNGGRLYVLLPNTDMSGTGGIMERFRNAGYESRPEEGLGWN